MTRSKNSPPTWELPLCAAPFPATVLPHIFKPATAEPFPSRVATPGTGEHLLHRLPLEWGQSSWDGRQKPAGGVGLHLGWPPQGGKPIPTPAAQLQSLPATLPAARTNGDPTELPHTALQGLKMQHPKQGLKMQSWG